MRHLRHLARPILISALLALVAAPGAAAHVTKVSGPFRIEIGWADEPPLTGLDNSVEVAVTDAGGSPVTVPAGALSVAVSYGGEAKTVPLVPGEQPGVLHGRLIPTRPGAYAFHVSGAIDGKTVDVAATCSETAFECVTDSTGAEFPARDPSGGEIAERLERESDRVQSATDEAEGARRLALVALALAAAALGGSLFAARRRKSGRP
jgi:hypothetical protein